MAFKFPYTNFEKINLDWIMQKIKALEPAVGMVSQADAALQLANETSAEALRVAGEADSTVATVTAQAAAAVETANDAKTIAQQAASGVIGDGSVTEIKLGADVISRFETDESNISAAAGTATAAQTTATNALSAAGVAQQLANQANNTAATANSTAGEALTKAEQALAAASVGSTVWTKLSNFTINPINFPATFQNLLFVMYARDMPSFKTTVVIPKDMLPDSGTIYVTDVIYGNGNNIPIGVTISKTQYTGSNSPGSVITYGQIYYQ